MYLVRDYVKVAQNCFILGFKSLTFGFKLNLDPKTFGRTLYRYKKKQNTYQTDIMLMSSRNDHRLIWIYITFCKGSVHTEKYLELISSSDTCLQMSFSII